MTSIRSHGVARRESHTRHHGHSVAALLDSFCHKVRNAIIKILPESVRVREVLSLGQGDHVL